MAALLTIPELTILVREEIGPEQEPFAIWTIEAASTIVRDVAKRPSWEISGENAMPDRARVIVQQLAKRSYLNPDAERSFNTGPIGAVTVEDYARTLELTPAEREYLEGIAAEGIEDPASGLLWTLSTANRPRGLVSPVVLNDDSGSAIIYANEGEFDTAFGSL